MSNNIHVLKIGGSLLSKSDELLFDFAYAGELRQMLSELVAAGHKFVVCVGGGFVVRKYQQIQRDHGESSEMDQHRVGVALTNLNAELLRSTWDELAAPQVLNYADYDKFVRTEQSDRLFFERAVLIAAASQPGRSNDYNALEMAIALGVDRVIDIKNVNGVYSADPKKDPTATRFEKLTWDEYLNVIGNPTHHVPGANYPVDPLAAKLAQEKGIEYLVCAGEIQTIKSAVAGDAVGTVIG